MPGLLDVVKHSAYDHNCVAQSDIDNGQYLQNIFCVGDHIQPWSHTPHTHESGPTAQCLQTNTGKVHPELALRSQVQLLRNPGSIHFNKTNSQVWSIYPSRRMHSYCNIYSIVIGFPGCLISCLLVDFLNFRRRALIDNVGISGCCRRLSHYALLGPSCHRCSLTMSPDPDKRDWPWWSPSRTRTCP